MTSSKSIEINGQQFELSKLNKILWPRDGYVKAELVHYYASISRYILKHLNNRPLVFTRYPNGIDEKSFYQKNAPKHTPNCFNTFNWTSSNNSSTRFLLVKEQSQLIWLANQGCIEIHPWLSRIDHINHPDYLIFDLDPSEDNCFEDVVNTALQLKNLLDYLELRSYIKTSGASGLHIYVPILNNYSYKQVRSIAANIAKVICASLPHTATIERSVKKRGAKVYIDYMQNFQGKTICAPYSIRPRDTAPVSMPIKWDELFSIKANTFNIKNAFQRLEQFDDIFAAVLSDKQDLTKTIKRLGLSL